MYIHLLGPRAPAARGRRALEACAAGVRGLHRAGGSGNYASMPPPPRAQAACATCFREIGEMPRHVKIVEKRKNTP